MKSFILLVIFAIFAVSALPVEKESEERVNGVNGWYVPKQDGSFEWINKKDAQDLLNNNLEPEGRADKNKVRFFLLTNDNPEEKQEIFPNKKSIESSYFNPNNPTRFTVHGWEGSGQDYWHDDIAESWLSRGEYNLIAVDWKKARTINYISAVSHVPKVGAKIAAMINFLKNDVGLSIETTQCIGHSLGSHVCGYTGKNTDGKLHTIVGLDPALPLYDFDSPKQRLNKDDASYVEIIHTNAGKLGFLQPIGKTDFYPNGGKKQPGCGIDASGACSHGRSHDYYAASIKLNNFPSVQCAVYTDAVKRNCGATYSSSRMGSLSNFLLEGGQYYVPVSKTYPYGLATD